MGRREIPQPTAVRAAAHTHTHTQQTHLCIVVRVLGAVELVARERRDRPVQAVHVLLPRRRGGEEEVGVDADARVERKAVRARVAEKAARDPVHEVGHDLGAGVGGVGCWWSA